MRQALLLRGINLGGRRLPMADLRRLLTELGFAEVSTYLASGQAVVTTERDPIEVAAEVEQRLVDELGLRTDVVIRGHEDLAAIVAANPFPTADDDAARHAVVFLRRPPAAGELKRLEAVDWSPDEYVVSGREIYLRLPKGFAESKLAIAVGKVKQPATTRNWNTVRKLLALTA